MSSLSCFWVRFIICNSENLNDMSKYKGKYRIETARATWWDYNNDGAYFITFCTHNGGHYFGECKNGEMTLSTIGAIVQGFWYEIPKHFPFVALGAFQVMPNHIHGILIIDKGNKESPPAGAESDYGGKTGVETGVETDVETLQCNVFTDIPDIPGNPDVPENLTIPPPNEFFSRISPKAGSLSVILRSFKSVCTKHIYQVFPDTDFDWLERFWDRIIRDEEAFITITNYIINNPKKWDDDCFFKGNRLNP